MRRCGVVEYVGHQRGNPGLVANRRELSRARRTKPRRRRAVMASAPGPVSNGERGRKLLAASREHLAEMEGALRRRTAEAGRRRPGAASRRSRLVRNATPWRRRR